MRLMEMAEQYRALLDAVEVESDPGAESEVVVPGTGEVLSQDAYLAALYAIEDSIEGKVDGYCAVIRELETTAESLRAVEKRYAARRQALENRAGQTRKRLAEGLTEAKRDKVKTEAWTVWLAAEGKDLVIDAAHLLPDRFFRPPPPRETLLDRALLKKEVVAAGGVLTEDGAAGKVSEGASRIVAQLIPNGKRPLNIR